MGKLLWQPRFSFTFGCRERQRLPFWMIVKLDDSSDLAAESESAKQIMSNTIIFVMVKSLITSQCHFENPHILAHDELLASLTNISCSHSSYLVVYNLILISCLVLK